MILDSATVRAIPPDVREVIVRAFLLDCATPNVVLPADPAPWEEIGISVPCQVRRVETHAHGGRLLSMTYEERGADGWRRVKLTREAT